ncbi:hypothetical protein OROGR_026098 [Orobanche gracilis]
MQSLENGTESTSELVESEQHVLNFLDSIDSYLILMDSLSSSLRQGMKKTDFEAEYNTRKGDPNTDLPHFTLRRWASSDVADKYSEEGKIEEVELLQEKSNNSPRVQHHEVLERRASCGSPVTPDHQSFITRGRSRISYRAARKERVKSLSIYGTLVFPKLRATQLSFETALEALVEIANLRVSLLRAYDQVQHDQKTAK